MYNIQARVQRLESSHSRDPLPPASKRPRRAAESCTHVTIWADREPEDLDGPSRRELSSDEDEEQAFTLSERSVALFTSAFSSTLSNTERWKVRKSFPVPNVLETRCPRLDPVFKSSVKAEVKAADSELSSIQAFVLDPVGPLARVVKAMEEGGDDFTLEDAQSALRDAIKLLGNTSSQICRLTRRKILKAVNPDIQDLADEEIYADTAPNLFGQGFEGKMKARAESIKLITAAKPLAGPKKFFRGARPFSPQRGGGQASRGGRNWTRRAESSSKNRK